MDVFHWRLPDALHGDMRASVERLLALASGSRPEFVPLVDFSVVPPAQSRLMEIRFEPLLTGEVHGLLQLNFEAPGETTVVLSLSGKGL